jgi:hypothetical protein
MCSSSMFCSAAQKYSCSYATQAAVELDQSLFRLLRPACVMLLLMALLRQVYGLCMYPPRQLRYTHRLQRCCLRAVGLRPPHPCPHVTSASPLIIRISCALFQSWNRSPMHLTQHRASSEVVSRLHIIIPCAGKFTALSNPHHSVCM